MAFRPRAALCALMALLATCLLDHAAAESRKVCWVRRSGGCCDSNNVCKKHGACDKGRCVKRKRVKVVLKCRSKTIWKAGKKMPVCCKLVYSLRGLKKVCLLGRKCRGHKCVKAKVERPVFKRCHKWWRRCPWGHWCKKGICVRALPTPAARRALCVALV